MSIPLFHRARAGSVNEVKSEHRRLGYRFENDWTPEGIRKQIVDYIEVETIPVNVMIEIENKIYDAGAVEEILRGARLITVRDCLCRSERGNCDRPKENCFFLDERGEWALEQGDTTERPARQVSVEESLDILREAHDAGLVLTTVLRKGDESSPKIICNCCSCCCYTLSGLLRFGVAPKILTSDFIASDSPDRCVSCGTCVDRCHFGSRELSEGWLAYDPGRCFGCGLCVSACPNHAIELTERN